MKKILSSLLAFAMVLALFSGVVIFNASAEEVQIHIPFINQYTLAQAQQMGKGNNSVSFAKDTDDKTIVTGTTSAANEWGLCTFIFDTAKGTDQWKKNKLVDGINIFEGAELSNKTAIAVKFANAQSVTSAANASNITNAFFTLGSSTKAVAIDLKQNTKSNGYFIYSFSKAEFVGAGWYQDCPTFKDAFFNTIDQVKITIVSNLGETELSFVIEDLYVVGAADTEELGKTIVKAESYEIDTTAERALYFDAAVTQAQVDAAVAKLNATIEKKIVIAQGGYSYTKLNGVQNWSAADVASLNLYGSDFAVSDKGIIGGVAQSIQMTVKGNGETRYCITSKTTSGMLTGDDNPFSFADATAGYKLSDFDGIAFALADADGKEIPVTKFTARLMPGINPGWNNYSRYEKVYTDISAIYRNGYYHVSFSDYANLAGETVNTIDLMSILFFVSGLKAGDKAYLSDIVAYKFDESLTVTGMLWEENYTPESWANLVAAAQTADDDTIAAAKAALKPAVVDLTTENMMTGWTTENVNAPVELNDDRLCDSIGDGLNADGVWNGGDFSKNTTFEANNNFSMTANVDFDGKSMGWKNLDRNTMDTASAGAYPALNSEGIENGAGIRFKLTVSDGGSYERLLVGLSNCAAPSQFATGGHREMYALKLVPEYFDEDGYINIPFSKFKAAWWSKVFAEDEIELAKVFIVEAYGVTAGTKLTISELTGYKPFDPADYVGDLWEYDYTSDSWAGLQAAAAIGDKDALIAAKDALVPLYTKPVTGNLMEGWNTTNVNAVVTANSNKLADYIKGGNADFTNNTTFEANNNLVLTAKATFDADKAMGWKNMDRSGTLATGGKNYGYPLLNVAGLKNSDGLRFKLEVEDGSIDHFVVGISNCATGAKEQYALNLKSGYADKDGYINLPWSVFEKASWGSAFTQANLEDAIVFLVEYYGATKFTTVRISDLHGYVGRDFDIDELGGYWQYNYTADSWTAYETAIDAARTVAERDAALALLVPYETIATTENFFKGWTTEAVNAVVTANAAAQLKDYIGDGLNTNGVWNKGDFSKNTTFAANDNFSMTATAAFADVTMGWKNLDRSATLNPDKNPDNAGADYPFMGVNVKGLSDAEGIRFKLDVTGKAERILIGLSNCNNITREMYALNIKPEYVGADGYINIPFSYFQKAWWCNAFSQAELEQVLVFIIEAAGVTEGTTITVSDLRGYRALTTADLVADLWEYNYTADSWTALQTAVNSGDLAATRTAIAALVARATKPVTENFFKGWTTEAVNAVVTANAAAQLKDYIGDGLNTNGVWNKGDFSKNTTFAADDNFSMTATATFADVTMGWKNLDRSATLNPDKNPDNAGADYPFMGANVQGLSKADGIRFKLEVTGGTAGRLLIGLSNCNNITREMYALNIKPEYVGADGYINIPFSYFQKAWWCNAFSQAELDQVIVFIIEAAGVTEGTTITVSDLKGYREIIAPSDEDKAALDAVVTKLQGYDFNDVYAADITAAQATKDSVDRDDVYDATAALQAIVDKFEAVDRATLKANIAAVKAIDATKWATEIADGTTVYYNFDATKDEIDAAAKVLQRIIDKPAAPTVTYESTDSTITVTPIEGAEYKLGDDAWQDSNVFENLGADVEYQLSARIKANDDHIESDATTVAAKTQKTTFGTATVTISGTERYLETLTATANDVPALIGTNYEITWYNGDGDKLGTGETYVLADTDIGKTIYAELSSSVASDTVKSDATAAIGKAVITGYTVPTAAAISYPQTLADSALTGGDTGTVTGTWTWVAPETRPLASQSGSTFDVVFTPDAAFVDLYEVIEEKVTLEINEANYVMTTFTAPSGLEVTGAFMETVNPDDIQMVVTDITYRDPAYQALLRASSKDTSTLKKLVLFKIFTFTYKGEEIDELYQGELTVTSFVGIDRAGETYSAWFFIADKPANYQGTVDAAGYLNVEHVVL